MADSGSQKNNNLTGNACQLNSRMGYKESPEVIDIDDEDGLGFLMDYMPENYSNESPENVKNDIELINVDSDNYNESDDIDIIFDNSASTNKNFVPKFGNNENINTQYNSVGADSINFMFSDNNLTANNASKLPPLGYRVDNFHSPLNHNSISEQRIQKSHNMLQQNTTRTQNLRNMEEDEYDEDEDNNDRLATFSEYKPAKFSYGKAHPSQVVETSTMSVVELPDLTYNLKIIEESLDVGCLSSLQLEAIAYACQRHETFLGNGERAAFFIGDGPGVGKGRTVAGIINENRLNGRNKAVWVSVSSDLRFDAIRDLNDIQCSFKVIPLNKVSYNESVEDYDGFSDEGILFTTYSTLIGVNGTASNLYSSRIEQLLDWCGSDFDGVLIFDECHKAKNLATTSTGKSTKTAVTVLDLQNKLPNARVVYCSATGASEPKNLGYMYRLGMWGTGTPFVDFSQFLKSVEKRGVGGMEIIAMDMKLRGMYIARQLSFTGVTFRILEISLEPEFKSVYNDSVVLWNKILNYSEKANVICSGGNKKGSSAHFWAKVWSYHQRFFKYLCIASKVRKVVEISKEAIKKGKCVVIGLQSTGESHLNENDYNMERITSTAGGLLIALVEKLFPVPVILDDDEDDTFSSKKFKRNSTYNDSNLITSKHSKFETQDALTAAGLPSCKYSWGASTEMSKNEKPTTTPDRMCIKWREELMADIDKLAPRLPANTLDELIDKLGGVNEVAEMTGRRGRIVKTGYDSYSYQPRSTDEVPLEYVNINERTMFMDGEKLVSIISEAASAGISLQADRRCANKRKRVHITLELPWSADKAVQQFGRSHRSNQVHAPEYIFAISELAGEKRFASTVSKRLESLGALTHGDRRVGETRDLSQFNIENKYGKLALDLLTRILKGEVPSVVSCPKYSGDFFKDAFIAINDISLGSLSKPSFDDSLTKGTKKISRFLNRLLGIQVDLQNAIFEFYSSLLTMIIQNEKKTGKFDSGILDWGISGESIIFKNSEKFHVYSEYGDLTVELTEVGIERGLSWTVLSEKYIKNANDEDKFYAIKSFRSRQPIMFIQKIENAQTKKVNYLRLRPNIGRSSIVDSIDNFLSRYEVVPYNAAKTLWETQYNATISECLHLFRWGSCKQVAMKSNCEHGKRLKTIYILSGALFGIWNFIEKVFGDTQIKITRVSSSDNMKKVGIIIPQNLVMNLKNTLSKASGDSFARKMYIMRSNN